MAIQMFLVSPAILIFLVCAALAAAFSPPGTAFPAASALVFYLTFIIMYLSPKFFGIAEALLRSPRRYGGVAKILAAASSRRFSRFCWCPFRCSTKRCS